MKKQKWLCFLVSILIVGCAPTPDENSVYQKSVETEQKWMIENDQQEEYLFPSEWNEKVSVRDDLSVEIQAIVESANTKRFPVYAVKPCPFPKDEINRIVDNLFPNAKLYRKSSKLTKDSIKEMMNDVFRAIENVDQNHPEFSLSEKQLYLEEMEGSLRELQVQYNDAPDENKEVEIKKLSSCIHSDDWLITVSIVDPDTSIELGIVEINSSPFGKDVDDTIMKMIITLNVPWCGINNSFEFSNNEDIKIIANEFLKKTGLDADYCINCIHQEESIPGGIIIDCTRKYEEVTVTFASIGNNVLNTSKDNHYSPFWDQEVISLIVFPEGIAFIIWNCPSDLISTENQNAKLISFDKIQKRALELLKLTQYPEEGAVSRRILIKKIKLGYYVVRRSGGGYSAIPVWDFFGYYYDRFTSQEDTQWLLDPNMEHKWFVYGDSASMLTINAIDGSIIDRSLGY